MAVEIFRVVRAAQAKIRELVKDRADQGEELEYQTAREAMLELHCDWQDLVTAVKRHEVNSEAALAAIRLAAAAIKFASDLGDPCALGLEGEPVTARR